MENVSIIFGAIHAQDALDYLTDRIELLHYAGNELFTDSPEMTTEGVAQNYATEMLSRLQDAPAVPIAPAIDLSADTSEHIAALRDDYACMLKEVKEMFPLSDDEHVVTNELTYLTETYADFAVNSLTLKQTTNLSICYYVYPYIQVDIANMQVIRHIPERAPAMLQGLLSGMSFGSLAGKLAKAIAGKVGGGIGGLILSVLIPDDDTLKQDWTEINKAIEITVKRELVINNQNLALTKMLSYLTDFKTEYVVRKKSGQAANELFTYLANRDLMLLNDVVGLFMHKVPEDYEMEGSTFGNFMLAANVHLSHLQEKALVKPNNSEKAVVSAWARQYTDYAEKAMARIIEKRLGFVTNVEEYSETRCTVGKIQNCTTHHGYRFYDNYPPKSQTRNEYGKKDQDDVRDRTNNEHKRYKEEKKSALESKFNSEVKPILENWKVLIDNPLPFKKEEKEFRW